MKKLMVMFAAVAMSTFAMAIEEFGSITPYEKDTNPSNANVSWYSCYFMTADAITAAAGGLVTSVDAAAYATWLQSNFADNKTATVSNASFTMPTDNSYYASGKGGGGHYAFSFESPDLTGPTAYLAVCFFDNQTDSAFQIIEASGFSYFVNDSGKSNWTAAPASENVPEPTSGLLLLLGMAGLALKRSRLR